MKKKASKAVVTVAATMKSACKNAQGVLTTYEEIATSFEQHAEEIVNMEQDQLNELVCKHFTFDETSRRYILLAIYYGLDGGCGLDQDVIYKAVDALIELHVKDIKGTGKTLRIKKAQASKRQTWKTYSDDQIVKPTAPEKKELAERLATYLKGCLKEEGQTINSIKELVTTAINNLEE